VKTIILGPINIKFKPGNNLDIEKVEFFIDEELVDTIEQPPFSYLWVTPSFSGFDIELRAYSSNSKDEVYMVDVWYKFF
jgi:hypothetical protein